MTKLELVYPVVGAAITTEEPAVTTALEAIRAWANGNIDEANLKAEGIPESKLSKAVQEKLVSNLGLKYRLLEASAEAASGDYIASKKAGITITLPAPTASRIVGVYSGVGACKVTASAGKIYGDYTNGATTVELLELQHILLFGYGENWTIIAGEPKREQTYAAEKAYSKAEMEAGVEPSATRLTYVTGVTSVEVGGVKVSNAATGGILVPPGQKVKSTVAATLSILIL